MQQLPLMRDGAEEGFHQGRVAIRRTREADPSLASSGGAGGALDDIDERLTRAFSLVLSATATSGSASCGGCRPDSRLRRSCSND